MFGYEDTYKISIKALAILPLLYCVNYLSGGVISAYTAMSPDLVFNKLELWRLISFPFAAPSLESLALFAFSFFFIAPKIESLIQKRIYPIFLFLLVFLQGAMTCLVFRGHNLTLAGLDGLSFFFIFLFAALSVSKKILPVWFRPAKTSILSLLVGVLWICALFMQYPKIGNEGILAATSSAIFGIFSAAIAYSKLRSVLISDSKKSRAVAQDKIPDIAIPSPEELKYALIARQVEKRQFQKYADDSYLYDSADEFVPDEDRLNELLDKILESGKESLTESELQYLKEYSKNI
jgi:hypothetical protein